MGKPLDLCTRLFTCELFTIIVFSLYLACAKYVRNEIRILFLQVGYIQLGASVYILPLQKLLFKFFY